MCHARSVTEQIFTEFFVSPSLLPGNALLYIPAVEGIKDSFEAIVEDGIVHCSLQKAIDFVMTNDEFGQWYTELKQLVSTGEIIISSDVKLIYTCK